VHGETIDRRKIVVDRGYAVDPGDWDTPINHEARINHAHATITAAGETWRDVARELVHGVLRRGEYRSSREELTPGRGDPLAPLRSRPPRWPR